MKQILLWLMSSILNQGFFYKILLLSGSLVFLLDLTGYAYKKLGEILF